MRHSTITQDEYGTVFNSQETYDGIALELAQGKSLTIAWTDLEGSQMDILFAMPQTNVGILQRGIRGGRDLFVAVMSRGAFAFEPGSESAPGYYAEKLNMGTGATTKALAELINGVRMALKFE